MQSDSSAIRERPSNLDCWLPLHQQITEPFIVRADEKLTALLELQAGIQRRPESSQRPTAQAPRCSTQRAGIASPHAEGDGLSGATSDGEFGFISGPAAFVGGVPLTRAMIPWAMPEAST
jgi:hypothetical protein